MYILNRLQSYAHVEPYRVHSGFDWIGLINHRLPYMYVIRFGVVGDDDDDAGTTTETVACLLILRLTNGGAVCIRNRHYVDSYDEAMGFSI